MRICLLLILSILVLSATDDSPGARLMTGVSYTNGVFVPACSAAGSAGTEHAKAVRAESNSRILNEAKTRASLESRSDVLGGTDGTAIANYSVLT